jgi:DNA-binding transcriptional MerR regulator
MLSIGELARLAQVSPRTLRHYDQLGLLVPAQVDEVTGYRRYELRQLAELRRILALRDLGVGLDRIAAVADAPVEELRGMLRLREVELAAAIDADQERLRRVAIHLDALERGELMSLDVVVKRSDPVRLASIDRVAPGYGNENIGPLFDEHVPGLRARLAAADVQPGRFVAHYEWPDDEGNVLVHLGFEIGEQPFDGDDDIAVERLPVVEVASALHRGAPVDISDTFTGLVRWIEASGYRIVERSREITLEWAADDSPTNVIEVQLPIAAA